MTPNSIIKASLVHLTLISLLFSCTKQTNVSKPALIQPTALIETSVESSNDLSLAASTDISRSLIASQDVTSVIASSSDQTISKIQSMDVTTAVNSAASSDQSVPQNDQSQETSDKIKEGSFVKISIKNTKPLFKLSNSQELVLHKKITIKETEIIQKIRTANEDHYCKLQVVGSLQNKDFLKLESSEIKMVDKESDLYLTQLTFKNLNASVQFDCTHTTSNFFIEDFYLNFSEIIDVYNTDNKTYDLKNFVNPRTENRKLNAIKLIDISKLEKVLFDESKPEGFALSNGKVESADKLSNLIAGGQENMGCMIAEKQGAFNTSKIYIRVAKGIAVDTPKDIPIATMYSIYRADEQNYFIISCLMKKSLPWTELIKAAKNVFKFEALSRLEYNKKYDEVSEIHKKLINKK